MVEVDIQQIAQLAEHRVAHENVYAAEQFDSPGHKRIECVMIAHIAHIAHDRLGAHTRIGQLRTSVHQLALRAPHYRDVRPSFAKRQRRPALRPGPRR